MAINPRRVEPGKDDVLFSGEFGDDYGVFENFDRGVDQLAEESELFVPQQELPELGSDRSRIVFPATVLLVEVLAVLLHVDVLDFAESFVFVNASFQLSVELFDVLAETFGPEKPLVQESLDKFVNGDVFGLEHQMRREVEHLVK